uniref:Uncharacterized protein n=1 Tax=Arundo donax TaxID=35708 RepID=A0A0A9AN42_ARUDO
MPCCSYFLLDKNIGIYVVLSQMIRCHIFCTSDGIDKDLACSPILSCV